MKKNTLWKPGHPQAKEKAKRKQDPLCKACPNHKTCKIPCMPMAWIDGNVELTETILKNSPSNQLHEITYTETLYALMQDKEARDIEKIERIRMIENPKKKLIAAALLAGLTQKQIAKLAHISQTRISRLYQSLK